MPRFAFATVALAFLAAACQPATTELTDAQRAEIEQAVIQAYQGYWNVWTAQESVDDYMGYFHDWAVSPLDGFESIAAVRAETLELWAYYHSWDVELGETRVLVLGPDVAVLEGASVSVVTDITGIAMELTQRSSWVWVLRDGQWRIVTGGFHINRQRPLRGVSR
jgi:hypothetical protein